MVTPLHSTFQPLPFDAAIDEFRVDGAIGVRSLVRELIEARGLISMFSGGSAEDFVVTRVLALEDDEIEFDFNTDPQREAALLAAPFLVVVGLPGPVKIQLRIDQFRVRRGEGANPKVLVANLPASGWRIQRRNAFRVRPPQHDDAVVVLRRTDRSEWRCPMIDLSVGGLAVWLPDGLTPPPAGTVWRHSRIEASGLDPIPCDLRLIRSDNPEPNDRVRLCCEYDRLPSDPARRIQLYVMDIEKRNRRFAR